MVYYEKSPIVEAVCEFKLELRRKITEEIVSEIHNLVISDFPTRKLQTVITEVQTGQAQEENRVMFWKKMSSICLKGKTFPSAFNRILYLSTY